MLGINITNHPPGFGANFGANKKAATR